LDEFKNCISKGLIILAIEGEILGHIIGEIVESNYERFGEITEIFVKKEYRGRHISTKLKNEFIEFLKLKKVNLCRIDVNPNNPAQNIYKKWGFKVDKYRMSLRF
jgi:ribosomal protein S18 acetylase RimI-like enzyme